MKILLATDGSVLSRAVDEEVAHRPFPSKTEIRIISAMDRGGLISNIGPMGVLSEY